MSHRLISIWNSSHSTADSAIVLPDSCRDLIMKTVGNECSRWFVSLLFDQSQPVRVEADSVTGVQISTKKPLLSRT